MTTSTKTEMPTPPTETVTPTPVPGRAAPTPEELYDRLHLRGGFHSTTNDVNELLMELLKLICKEG